MSSEGMIAPILVSQSRTNAPGIQPSAQRQECPVLFVALSRPANVKQAMARVVPMILCTVGGVLAHVFQALASITAVRVEHI